jgi:hypothetical protein
MDKLKLRYLIREVVENVANISSKFSIGDKVTTVDGDTALVTMAEHPFYTVELEETGTSKSFNFKDLAPFQEKIVAKTSEGIKLEEARELFNEGVLKINKLDKDLIRNTDIGDYGLFENKKVPLDIPFINEAEFRGKNVKLNSPKRGGSKAYYVYVKNPKTGRVKKVSFGSGGLRAKINNPKARKAFSARHNCPNKKDRTKAGYWSCNLPRYAKQLGLGANKNTFW